MIGTLNRGCVGPKITAFMSDSTSPLTPGSMRSLMHDLNGQLFVVRGSAELMEMTASDPGTRDKAKRLVEACDRLADIAQQLHKQIRDKNL